MLAQLALAQLALAQDAEAQEADAQLASDRALLAQDADAHDADAHDAVVHVAEAHDADAQDAEAQDADAHDASVVAARQASPSNVATPSGPGFTNCASAAFGFGGRTEAAAAAALTSPTPVAIPPRRCVAVAISAPLTSSGVQVGCSARSLAAMPLTTGAENEVPDIHIQPAPTTRSGKVCASTESFGTGPTIILPGATSSGLANPSPV